MEVPIFLNQFNKVKRVDFRPIIRSAHERVENSPPFTKILLILFIISFFFNAKESTKPVDHRGIKEIAEQSAPIKQEEIEKKKDEKTEAFIGISVPIRIFLSKKDKPKTKTDKANEIRKKAYQLLLKEWNPQERTFKKKGKGRIFGKQNNTITVTKKEMLLYAPDFIVEEVLYNVKCLASITAAQTDIESNWFNSSLAVKSNNGYGIKDVKLWNKDPEKWMSQYRGGHVVAHDDTPRDKFIKFDTKWACIRFHTKFLTELHYKKHIGKDFNGWAYGLKSSGYATDKKYPKTLNKMYEILDLETMDRIAAQLRKEYN